VFFLGFLARCMFDTFHSFIVTLSQSRVHFGVHEFCLIGDDDVDDVGRLNSYLVDPASSHMLVSKIKPCMSKYKHFYSETANGSLYQL